MSRPVPPPPMPPGSQPRQEPTAGRSAGKFIRRHPRRINMQSGESANRCKSFVSLIALPGQNQRRGPHGGGGEGEKRPEPDTTERPAAPRDHGGAGAGSDGLHAGLGGPTVEAWEEHPCRDRAVPCHTVPGGWGCRYRSHSPPPPRRGTLSVSAHAMKSRLPKSQL